MSKKTICEGSTYITKKRVSQWEDLMKKYCEKHKETCKVEEEPVTPLTKFPTGSSYVGAYDAIGMSGYGEYTFTNGVVYRGQFDDGMFHGKGELIYKKGSEDEKVIRGHWEKGVLKERQLLFNGFLEYNERNWKYCKVPDRRYAAEYETDLHPAGKADVPSQDIPSSLYDTGYGYYDPKSNAVYKYDRTYDVIRGPSRQERRWILENCRKGQLDTIGPRQDYYTTWTAPVVHPIPPPHIPILDVTSEEEMVEPDFYNPFSDADLQSIPNRKFLSSRRQL